MRLPPAVYDIRLGIFHSLYNLMFVFRVGKKKLAP